MRKLARWCDISYERITIWTIAIENSSNLRLYLSMIAEKNIVPMIAPKLGIAVTSAASSFDIGPDSNGENSLEVKIK